MKAILLLLALLIGLGMSSSVLADQYIDCNSQSGNMQRCPADTRGGVSLTTQYSRAGCYQNDTWGYDRNGIWVSNGCRAQFRIGESRSNHDDKVAAVAAIVLIGAAIAVAADKHNKHDDRDSDRYGRDYDRGCSAARHREWWSDYESRGWQNGFRDCR